ncbi:MAG: hypothetical protein NTY09_00640 [bacterium]|nr:hypothetical protein [bacterium]
MAAKVLDGKSIVNRITRRIERDVTLLRKQHYIEVGLGILLVTGDQVSMADSGKIATVAEQAGIKVHIERVAQRNVARRFYPTLEEYTRSPFVQGIYIQLPLPTQIIPLKEVMDRLPLQKDVGGLHFLNRGMATYPAHEVDEITHPPEILAVFETLKECEFEVNGGNVVIVGSDVTAGITKLISNYLYDKGCNVRLLKFSNISPTAEEGEIRKLRRLDEKTEKAPGIINPDGEAVITCCNQSKWLSGSRLAPRSIVIDMGYKFTRGSISGDCDFQTIVPSASYITPVPGGFRNIAHVMILSNLIDLIRRQKGTKEVGTGKTIHRRFSQEN